MKNIKHLTILLAVDASNMSNGGLEVVEGSQAMEVPIDRSNNCIENSWVIKQTWVPVELEAGKVTTVRSFQSISLIPSSRTIADFRVVSRSSKWCKQQQLG